MKKFLIKGLVLIIILSLSQLGVSMSYFSDTAIVSGNTLTASSLEVGVRSGQGNFVSDPLDLEPGDSVARDIYLQKLGVLDFKYRSEYEYVSGDTELCDALQLRVWYNWYDAPPPSPGDHSTRHMDLKYNGSLSSFDNFDTSEPMHDPDMQLLNTKTYYSNIFYADNEHWFYYQVSLPSDASSTLRNETCTFNIRMTGWQTNFDDESMGFSDTEVIESTVGTGVWGNEPSDNESVVINEVHYNTEDGIEEKNEWIELYNNTDEDISLKGWGFVDNTGSERTINAPVSIPARGFAVVSHDKSVWADWTLPDRTVTINLGKQWPWLNNSGDQLILRDATDTEIDFVAWEKGYGNVYPDWDIVANKGQSIARKEKGLDTDSVDDWEVLTSPNPGTNPHPPVELMESEETFQETGDMDFDEEIVIEKEAEGIENVSTDIEEEIDMGGDSQLVGEDLGEPVVSEPLAELKEPELPEGEQEIKEEEQTEKSGGELEDNDIIDEQEVVLNNPDEQPEMEVGNEQI